MKRISQLIGYVEDKSNLAVDKVIGPLEEETPEQRAAREKFHEEQMRHLQEDLTPYLITCLLNCVAGLALIGLVIYEFAAQPLINALGREFLGGMHVVLPHFWTLFCLIPLFLGIAELAISLVGLGSAALERAWHEASILDVILHHAPEGRLKQQLKRLPLHCEARETYLRCMTLFVLILLIINGSVYAVLKNGVSGVSSSQAITANSGPIRDLLDYSSVIFNECCALEGETKQGIIAECKPDGSSQTCDIPALLTPYKDQICPCFVHGSGELVKAREKYVKDSDICDLMKKAYANISDSDTIPGTGTTIRMVIPNQVKGAPLVGDLSVYGCGVGYARGFQFALTKWIIQSIEPYIVAILAISGIQALALLLGLILTCTHDKPEESEEEIELRLQMQNGMVPASSQNPKMKRSPSAVNFSSPRIKTYYRKGSFRRFPSTPQLLKSNQHPEQAVPLNINKTMSNSYVNNQTSQFVPLTLANPADIPEPLHSHGGHVVHVNPTNDNLDSILASKSFGNKSEKGDGEQPPPRPPRSDTINSKYSNHVHQDRDRDGSASEAETAAHHSQPKPAQDAGSTKRGLFTNLAEPPI